MFLNVGAGPLSDFLSRTFTRRALAAGQYVSFRDNESQTLARTIGFAGESCIFPDSVYGLTCAPFVRNVESAIRQPAVGVAAVPYGDPRLHPKETNSIVYDRFLDNCRRMIRWLSSQGYVVTLFGTDVGVDARVNADILRSLREQGNASLPQYAETQTVGDVLRTISAMDYVITCRFHGVVFAHLLNKPVLAIAHHPKVADLMKALGLSKYCVDIRKFDANLLADRFEALVRERDEIKHRMTVSLAACRSILAGQFDELFPPEHEAMGKKAASAARL
jgi:polysaccharide pyruvyl transferase WcaK-like protein